MKAQAQPQQKKNPQTSQKPAAATQKSPGKK